MSYDIGLYDKAFLARALAEGLGDWTGAPPLPLATRRGVESRLRAMGYRVEFSSPEVTELIHRRDEWGLQVHILASEIGFTVPYWEGCEDAILTAVEVAMALAEAFDLGVHDPQAG